MQNMRNKIDNEAPKHKDRHIVTWTQQEDDILREQIGIHGTENWAIIASKFEDKTTRQCRRRWYTYLNSDFKKGGWSPEEDMLLCEAQKIFGNRWTEIAKVVSGRTDNAVKNRFTTLCKKRAKYEALAKENNSSYINMNNKRGLLENELNTDKISETGVPFKKMRKTHIIDGDENCNGQEKLLGECGTIKNQQLRPPLAVLVHNFHNIGNFPTENHTSNTVEASNDAQNNKNQGIFLKKDDPKIITLLQQAELLSSLAIKVNTDNTDQSLENAWKILQHFLNQTEESDMLRRKFSDKDFQLEVFKDLIENSRGSNEGSQPYWRQPDLYDESPGSSESSTGSIILSQAVGDKTEEAQAEISVPHQDIGAEIPSIQSVQQNGDGESINGIHISPLINQGDIFMSCHESESIDGVLSAPSPTGYGSPLQVTPVFRSLAAGIPSPKFSESERSFLMKTLGVESPSPYLSSNPSKRAPCKRAILQSL